MKYTPLAISFLTFLSTTSLADTSHDDSCERILEAWENERIFYKPKSPNQNEWNGTLYSYAEKKMLSCYRNTKGKKDFVPAKGNKL